MEPEQQAKPVKLQEIADVLGFSPVEIASYLHVPSGEIIWIEIEALRAAEEEEDPPEGLPEWQQEQMLRAIHIRDHDEEYLAIPHQLPFENYAIMEEFVANCPNRRIADALDRVMHGSGAFRRFKDTLYRYGIEDQWFNFERECLQNAARSWCEANGVKWTE